MRLNSEKQQQPSQDARFCAFFGSCWLHGHFVDLCREKKQNMHRVVPPRKINMKPKKKRVWKMMFLLKGVMFRFRFLRFLESLGAPKIRMDHPPTNNKSNPMVGTYKEGLQEMSFFNIGRWLRVVFQMTFKEKSEETTKTQITVNLKFSTSPN